VAWKYSQLADALVTQLTTEIDDATKVIERRLVPRRDRTEFAGSDGDTDGKTYISIYAGGHAFEIKARQVDDEDWTIVLAVQALGPKPDASSGDNAFARVTESDQDPVEWGDTFFATVEQIKGYWRAETESEDAGPLRDLVLAGCQWMRLENNPLYLPVDLAENGILTSLISLTYKVLDP